jgi:MFS family permease
MSYNDGKIKEKTIDNDKIIQQNKAKEEEKKKLSVGTLTYTKIGLVSLFAWMLWGDFCFSLMERLIPQLLPLTLKNLDASNAVVGLLVGSIPAAINMILNPIISFRSDRKRTRWGRRIPYIFFASPFVTICLIGIGWAPKLAEKVQPFLAANVSPAVLGLIFVAILCVGFQAFNTFVGSVFYYLFADVVPEAYIGRFMAFFRVVGAAAGFVFSRYIIGLADNYLPWIFTGVAIIYFISFMLMCFQVKEGEYPEPSDDKERKNFSSSVKLYFKECFSNPYYRWFFLGTAFNAASVICRTMFNIFFARENLGMTLDQYGKIMSWGMLLALVLYIPLGFLIDKFHPIRIYIVGIVLVVLTNIFGYFMINSYETFFIFSMSLAVVYAIQSASNLPLYVALLPKERWGQFCSAQAMFQAFILIIANYGGGLMIDWIGDYRFIFIWDAIFTSIALIAIIFVYVGWKKYGGQKAYVAPAE